MEVLVAVCSSGSPSDRRAVRDPTQGDGRVPDVLGKVHDLLREQHVAIKADLYLRAVDSPHDLVVACEAETHWWCSARLLRRLDR
jgi:hypothetical protein